MDGGRRQGASETGEGGGSMHGCAKIESKRGGMSGQARVAFPRASPRPTPGAPAARPRRTLDDGQQVALHALRAGVTPIAVLAACHNLVDLVDEHDACVSVCGSSSSRGGGGSPTLHSCRLAAVCPPQSLLSPPTTPSTPSPPTAWREHGAGSAQAMRARTVLLHRGDCLAGHRLGADVPLRLLLLDQRPRLAHLPRSSGGRGAAAAATVNEDPRGGGGPTWCYAAHLPPPPHMLTPISTPPPCPPHANIHPTPPTPPTPPAHLHLALLPAAAPPPKDFVHPDHHLLQRPRVVAAPGKGPAGAAHHARRRRGHLNLHHAIVQLALPAQHAPTQQTAKSGQAGGGPKGGGTGSTK